MATLLVMAACDPFAPEQEQVQDVVADQTLTQTKQADLLRRAQAGDWMAARDLGVSRLHHLQFDRLTYRLLLQWAEHDAGGGSAFAYVASKSCKRAERQLAIHHLERYRQAQVDKGQPPTLSATLAEMRRDLDTTRQDCLEFG